MRIAGFCLKICSLLLCNFCGLFAITLVKAVDSSRRIYQFLFSSEKRVAGGADFHVQLVLAR
jgi:hypothetical protein